MKNLLVIIAICFGLGFYPLQAQNDPGKTSKSQNEQQDKNAAERKADRNDKSKAGEKLDKTGNAVGSGAKKGWGKVKHNKLTKNVFNQPEDK